MKKLLFTFIFFILVPAICSSQKALIELSVEWKQEKVYFQTIDSNNNFIDVPYLTINYKNLTKDKIILKRPVQNNEFYLPIFADILFNPMPIVEESATKYNNHSKEYYICYLTDYAIFDEQDTSINRTTGQISYNLMQLYRVFDFQKRLDLENSNLQLKCFNYPQKNYITFRDGHNKFIDIEMEKPLFSNQYVILLPNEEIKQKLCLLHFYLLKGTYFFKIKTDDLIDIKYNNNGKYNYLYKMPEKENIIIKNIEIIF